MNLFEKVVIITMRTRARSGRHVKHTDPQDTHDTDTRTHHAREHAVSAIEVADTPQRDDERGVAMHARVDG